MFYLMTESPGPDLVKTAKWIANAKANTKIGSTMRHTAREAKWATKISFSKVAGGQIL